MKIDTQLKKKLKDQLIKSIQTQKQETVIVKSPYSMTKDELSSMRSTLKIPQNHTLENVVDKELIGGFVIQHGSNIIDASVKTNITNLVARLQAAL